MNAELLEKVLADPRLPSLPAIAARVVEMTRTPAPDLAELARAIAQDQALSARLLRTVNSSLYGLRTPCATVHHAVVMLGAAAVQAIVLGFTLVPSLSGDRSDGFDYVGYWRRGLYTAIAARHVGRAAGLPCAEECFVGGLLQDLGMIALHRALGTLYAPLLAQARAAGDHSELARLESSQLEIQHADVGSMLARRWHFPDALVMAIKYHERPGAAPPEHRPLVRAVALGNVAADIMTVPEPAGPLTRFYSRAEEWFGLSPDRCDELLRQIGDDAAETASILDLGAGVFPDAEAILAQAHQRLLAMTIPQGADTDLEAPDAATDPLTGLPGPLGLERALIATFEQARAGAGPMALLLLDVDAVGRINAEHSREVGDAALAAVAARLTEIFQAAGAPVHALRPGCFAVLLPRTDHAAAARLADQARRRIASSPFRIETGRAAAAPLRISVSGGLACMDAATADRYPDAAGMLRLAEQALRAAKGAGRNTIRAYAPAAAAA
jgi:diguanylate cyclase (GGDEF)-like protein